MIDNTLDQITSMGRLLISFMPAKDESNIDVDKSGALR
jgi:hypothetical protein